MQNKRLKLLVILAIILVVVIISSILLRGVTNQGQQTEVTPTPPPYITVKPTFIPDNLVSKDPATPIYEPGDLVISGIAVNNFLENPIRVNERGDILMHDDVNYQIVYFPDEEIFIISILNPDLGTWQQVAEQELVNILEINSENVCRLSIEVSVPSYVTSEFAGMTFIPSICEHHEDSIDGI